MFLNQIPLPNPSGIHIEIPLKVTFRGVPSGATARQGLVEVSILSATCLVICKLITHLVIYILLVAQPFW